MKRLLAFFTIAIVSFIITTNAQTASLTPAETITNPFIGKWVGEWNNIRGKLEAKGELVVKENGKLEFVFGNEPRVEYPYTISGDCLSFTSGSGKVREFKFNQDGNLKGELKNPSSPMQTWVCVLTRVP